MAPDDDISIEEKRVYAGTTDRTDAYVATGTGVVRVAVSGDKVGAFELVARDAAADVAVLARDAGRDLVGVATAEGLLVAPTGTDPAFARVDLGPLAAVDAVSSRGPVDGDAFLVAGADGEIHRVGAETNERIQIGSVPDPRAVDGRLVAAADGVHRAVETGGGPGLEPAGLDDARDVAGAGVPLAATGDGLYRLANGWVAAVEASATTVAADGDGHATAVVDGALLRSERSGAAAWTATPLPVDERPAALGYGPGTVVAVTDAGTLCVDAGDGWRHQPLGVPDVGGVALAPVADD